jgi:hypothetical protein
MCVSLPLHPPPPPSPLSRAGIYLTPTLSIGFSLDRHDGKFLVRPKGNGLILSVMFRGKATHHVVEQLPTGTYVINGKDSGQSSVPQLLMWVVPSAPLDSPHHAPCG